MTNEEIDDMLSKVDSIARNFDIYEYGLPMGHDGCLLEMRQAAKESIRPMENAIADSATRIKRIGEIIDQYLANKITGSTAADLVAVAINRAIGIDL